MNRPEVAALLRRARARIEPEDVGLAHGGRRRVPGLRREEVALLAGVSVDYIVRLEQGRGPHPSAQVMAALCRALRLTDDETRELFDLTDLPAPRAGVINRQVRPSVQRLLDRLADVPVLVISAAGDVLAWNEIASALLGDFSRWPVRQRNIVWQRFLGEPGRVSLSEAEHAQTAAQSVASLRIAAARYPDDDGLRRLIAELRRSSPGFVSLWDSSSAGPWRNDSKTVVHPELGPITLDCDTMHLPDADQMVIVYSAQPGSEAAAQLDLLRVVGRERVIEAPKQIAR